MSMNNGSAPVWDAGRAQAIIDAHAKLEGASLPILHALQDEFGYIHAEALPLIAETLNLSRAEVVGVVHFYHDFRHEPPGRHTLKVCRAEACQSLGCESLVEHLSEAGIVLGETTADGAITADTVYCLGNCALGPSVMLDGRLYGRVTPSRADQLLATARSGA
jgi:formate dehydrogenase subunit gamma